MDQVNLQISENTRKAIDQAFDEAQQLLVSAGATFDPFTVSVVDGGLEILSYDAVTSPEMLRESVKMMLAQDMPEGYALCYDGWVETDDGHLDAVMVEVADRGSDDAFMLVLIYSLVDGEYTFETDYGYAGPVAPLYPAGTKPIVSGLDALQASERADDPASDLDADLVDEKPADSKDAAN